MTQKKIAGRNVLQKSEELTDMDSICRPLVEGERPGRRPGTGRRMSLAGGVGAGHREVKALISKLSAQAACRRKVQFTLDRRLR